MDEVKEEMVPEAEGWKKALPWTVGAVLLIPVPIVASCVLAYLQGREWLNLVWVVVLGVICGHLALRRTARIPQNKVRREVVGTLQGLGYAVLFVRLVCGPVITEPGRPPGSRGGGFCKNNLKQIGLAMQIYATDYDGWFPAGPEGADSSYALGILSYAGQNYIGDVSQLLCPFSEDHIGNWELEGSGRSAADGGLRASSTSYEYVVGFRDDSPADFMVAFDDAPRSHQRPRFGCIDAPKGRNVLFVDAHVVWMLEKGFQERMEWQKEMMKRIEEGGDYVPFDWWREGEGR